MVAAVKRVGKSGQISLGKERAGRLYREETRDDGTIVLSPVIVLSQDHWLVRDKDKIVEAMEWAAENPPRATKLDALIAKAQKAKKKKKKKAPSR